MKRLCIYCATKRKKKGFKDYCSKECKDKDLQIKIREMLSNKKEAW